MSRKTLLLLLIGLCLPASVSAQQMSPTRLQQKVRAYRITHEHEFIREYFDLLSIPNVSSDLPNIRRNAEFIKQMMEKRGIKTRIMETGGSPVVYGEVRTPRAQRTLMFYAHYDGQPVDQSQWIDTSPFRPILRPGKMHTGSTDPKPIPLPQPPDPFHDDWRIYARGASDDKAPIAAILFAIDALKDIQESYGSNLKFIFEGEEEASSPNLQPFVAQHKDLLRADVLYICDGPVYYNNQPSLKFGARGIVTVSLTVYGPNTNLHSGHYGNWAPNPAMKLAQLLAGMKDDTGNVLIEGFYDTVAPLSPREIQALKDIEPFDNQIKELYGFCAPEGGGKTLMELINRPSLNIRGLQAAWVGSQARTVIPAQATAAIDIRLVKGNTPADMVAKFKKHLQKQGYHVLSRDPDQNTRMKYPRIAKLTGGGGYPAQRTSMDLPLSQFTINALAQFHGQTPVLVPTSGGSVPLYIFTDTLGIPTISVPIVNHDNNQHQPNENLRLGHFFKGIETFAALLTAK
ncbi:MAG: hypothetical protein AMJ79_10920 [Phycisphaerae bacterium SM23_30]|nr:MAG: hypothetical protein AMJ79_10920 [Phycisphaerae bacterium SM23_30]